jgi:ABC transporter substrate binding protein
MRRVPLIRWSRRNLIHSEMLCGRSAGLKVRQFKLRYRYGAGDPAKIQTAAAELVQLAPDVIYAVTLKAVQAVSQKTLTIPIVFSLVADPVGMRVVTNLRHPGGNVTGFEVWDPSVSGKWLQLLKEIAPGVRRVGVLYKRAQPLAWSYERRAQAPNCLRERCRLTRSWPPCHQSKCMPHACWRCVRRACYMFGICLRAFCQKRARRSRASVRSCKPGCHDPGKIRARSVDSQRAAHWIR